MAWVNWLSLSSINAGWPSRRRTSDVSALVRALANQGTAALRPEGAEGRKLERSLMLAERHGLEQSDQRRRGPSGDRSVREDIRMTIEDAHVWSSRRGF